MSDKIYEFITNISAPPIFSGFVIFLFVFYIPNGELSFFVEMLLSLIFASFLPLGIILISNKVGWTEYLHVPKRQNRTRIYFSIFFSYVLGAFTFWYFSTYPLFIMFVAYMIISLVLGTVNLFYKVSVHTAGIVAPVTVLSYVVSPVFSLLYFFLVPVYCSRYMLDAHSHKQLLCGIFIGFIVTLVVLYFFY
ncbi:MAG: hypothetical protein ABEK17_03365 [Candidatus Aenigmatarchaeota archaeon]